MALGYVIAALLEAAGLIGLALALVRIRAERAEKAAGLRSFLRSGQSTLAPPDSGSVRRRFTAGTRVIAIPYAIKPGHGSGPTGHSAARSALQRAIARNGQRFQATRGIRLSAG